MTLEDIAMMLYESDIPYAYDHFAEGESPDPPFICYLTPGSENFGADGGVYFKINEVRVELYTDKKDPTTEKRMEDILDAKGIFYDKTETWISEERLYEVLYRFTVPAIKEGGTENA